MNGPQQTAYLAKGYGKKGKQCEMLDRSGTIHFHIANLIFARLHTAFARQ